MSSAAEILADAHAAGVKLHLAGDRLTWAGPMTEDLLFRLRTYRREVSDLLDWIAEATLIVDCRAAATACWSCGSENRPLHRDAGGFLACSSCLSVYPVYSSTLSALSTLSDPSRQSVQGGQVDKVGARPSAEAGRGCGPVAQAGEITPASAQKVTGFQHPRAPCHAKK
ncbi:MAG: hypothetical protein IT452_17980 [Planctomycetia bacterium]|nr:hypothetical protein [Planctomycetia bacterium]